MTMFNSHHETHTHGVPEKRTSRRGFASMDKAKQREIASKGGKAAHAAGTAHEFDSREAAEAGRKGGEAVSRDRAHMAEIGGKGGRSRGANRAAAAAATHGSQMAMPSKPMSETNSPSDNSKLSEGESKME